MAGAGTAGQPSDAGNEVNDPVLGGQAAQHMRTSSEHSPWFPGGDRFDSSNGGQEPISGVTGAGTADQPYDAGNQVEGPNLGGEALQHTTNDAQLDQPFTSEHRGQEPISGVTGAGTVYEPYDSGNRVDDTDLGGKALQHISPQDAQNPAIPSFVPSIFTNPFGKCNSMTAAPEPDMDPKFALGPTQHRNAPLEAVVEPALPLPKRDKGKGKMMYDTDSTSSRTQHSDTTTARAESIATSHTGKSTISTPGGIPTAGGIPLGERARIDRERRPSLRPSMLSESSVPADQVPLSKGAAEGGLQRVVEYGERKLEASSTHPFTTSKVSEAEETPPSTARPARSSGVTFAKAETHVNDMKTDATNTTYLPEPAAGERRRSSAVGRLASSIGKKLSVRNKEGKGSKSVPKTETIAGKK